MTRPPTDALIEALADRAVPVRPLAAPEWRATIAIALVAATSALLITAFGDLSQLLARYAGRHNVMMVEMAAMALTAALAIAGAFAMSVPGGSRRWLLAPLPSALVWIAIAGAGCLGVARPSGHERGMDCLLFILAASALIGAPLVWRLSRAHPLDPLPVAALAGLGSAAAGAFLLQFFHPFAVTALDFAVHVLAVLLVIAIFARASRKILAPTP
ncbi:MAG TPA: NrsF family protein [Sphingomicrobium sp.]|nr:NrsF family protein [Sphingomicrobium sp.]